MLQNLREHIHGWIAGVIVAILVLAFALWGMEYYLSGNSDHSTVAKVNGEKITESQVAVIYKQLRTQQHLDADSGVPNDALQKRLKAAALNKLIGQYVLAEAAIKAGFAQSNEQLGAILAQVPAFQQNGQFSQEMFQRVIANFFPSQQAFLTDLKQNALTEQVKIGIQSSAFTLPNEVDRQIELLEQKRDITVMNIPNSRFLATVKIADADINDYYKKHQADFMTHEQVSLQYILLSTEEIAKKVSVTEQELNQYYQENQAEFTKSGAVMPFESVRAQVEKNLRQQKVEQLIADDSEQLSNLTYTNPDTLKVAADTLGLPIQTTDYFANTGGKTGIIANPKVVAVAFSDNVLKQRNNSDLINLDPQSAVVIRVADYKPAKVRPLTEVHAEIEAILKAQAVEKATQELGTKILADLKKGIPAETIAKENNLTLVTKLQVGREAADVSPAVRKLIFDLAVPSTKPVLGGAALSDGSYAVVMLTKVQSGVPSAIDAQKRQQLQNIITNQFGIFDYSLYVTDKMNKAKIKYEAP